MGKGEAERGIEDRRAELIRRIMVLPPVYYPVIEGLCDALQEWESQRESITEGEYQEGRRAIMIIATATSQVIAETVRGAVRREAAPGRGQEMVGAPD